MTVVLVPAFLALAVVLVLVVARIVTWDRRRLGESMRDQLERYESRRPLMGRLEERVGLPPEPDGVDDFWENAVAGLSADVLRDILEGPAAGTQTPADPREPVRVDIYADDTPATLAGRYGRHVAALAWAEWQRGAGPHMVIHPPGTGRPELGR